MTYQELKAKQQKEVNEFPFGFAFNREQFKEMMAKWGLTENDTDKIYSIGAGGYIRKSDSDALDKMFERHKQEMAEFKKNQKELYQGFIKELWNHEYYYMPNDEAVLRCFGYSEADLENDKELKTLYYKAVREYMRKAG